MAKLRIENGYFLACAFSAASASVMSFWKRGSDRRLFRSGPQQSFERWTKETGSREAVQGGEGFFVAGAEGGDGGDIADEQGADEMIFPGHRLPVHSPLAPLSLNRPHGRIVTGLR